MAEALRAASAADQLRTPREVRRRSRRRWYARVAMVVAGLVIGIGVVVYLALRALSAFGKGDPPALDAMAPMIPAALLDSARSAGIIGDADTVRYVFAPHGHGLADALLVTTKDLIAVRGGAPQRYPMSLDYDITMARTSGRGLVLIRHPVTREIDTLYTSVSGLEQQILSLGLRRVLQQP
jgi:hypothetical protein